MAEDNLEVNVYVAGCYQGKRRVGKDSICGALLSGDISTGLAGIREMVQEINNIPGVQAKCGLTPAKADRAVCPDCGADIPNDGACWYCENTPSRPAA